MRDWQKDWEMNQAAQPGAWIYKDGIITNAYGAMVLCAHDEYDDEIGDWVPKLDCSDENMKFILESREALPYWLQQFRELEAQAAVLREALKACINAMQRWGAEEDGIPDDPIIGAWTACEQAGNALSFSAGRDLLERVRKLEAVAKAANDYLTKCICYECEPRGDNVCRLGIGGPCPMQELAKALAALEGGEQDG